MTTLLHETTSPTLGGAITLLHESHNVWCLNLTHERKHGEYPWIDRVENALTDLFFEYAFDATEQAIAKEHLFCGYDGSIFVPQRLPTGNYCFGRLTYA